jgi:hypothetical protein
VPCVVRDEKRTKHTHCAMKDLDLECSLESELRLDQDETVAIIAIGVNDSEPRARLLGVFLP